jgi:hypothetical protein
MKVDIVKYVTSCGICQKVKAEHKRPTLLLMPLEIPEWKWDNIAMDFVVGLPRSPRHRTHRDGVDICQLVVHLVHPVGDEQR